MPDKIDIKDLMPNLESQLKAIETQLVEITSTLDKMIDKGKKFSQSMRLSDSNSGEGIKERIENLEKLEKATEEILVVEKKRIQLNKQKQTVEKDRLRQIKENEKAHKETVRNINKEIAAQKKQIEQYEKNTKAAISERENRRKRNQEIKNEIKLNNAADGSLEQVEAQLNKTRKAYASLTREQRDNTKEGKQTLRQIQALAKQQDKLRRSMAQNQHNVGKYSLALQGAGKKALAFGGAIGAATVGVDSFINIAADAINIIKNFELAVSKLRAIMRDASKEEFDDLINEALRLGATTEYTAEQVVSLQTEFGKFGFTATETAKVTAATLDLATATGEDLTTSAGVAASTLRGLGLNVSNTRQLMDVMARSFTKSALDLDKFKESMKLVAPIAKAADVSLERVTAMLSTLADAGISGTNAGTALRRILTDMSKGGKDASSSIRELAEEGLNLEGSFDEVGRTAQTALLVLSENVEKTDELTVAYEDAGGAAAEMAAIMRDNLATDIKLAGSAWDGFVMGLNSGSGIISKISRKVVNSFTDILNSLSKLTKTQEEISLTETIEKGQKAANEFIADLSKGNADIIKENNIIISQYEDYIKALERLGQTPTSFEGETDQFSDTFDEFELYQEKIAKLREENEALANSEALTETGRAKAISDRISSLKAQIHEEQILLDLAVDRDKSVNQGLIDLLKYSNVVGQSITAVGFLSENVSESEQKLIDQHNALATSKNELKALSDFLKNETTKDLDLTTEKTENLTTGVSTLNKELKEAGVSWDIANDVLSELESNMDALIAPTEEFSDLLKGIEVDELEVLRKAFEDEKSIIEARQDLYNSLNEGVIEGMRARGATEKEIIKEQLSFRLDQAQELFDFLSETEGGDLTQISDARNEIAKLKNEITELNETDPKFANKFAGAMQNLTSIISDTSNVISSIFLSRLESENEAIEQRRELIQQEIEQREENINSLEADLERAIEANDQAIEKGDAGRQREIDSINNQINQETRLKQEAILEEEKLEEERLVNKKRQAIIELAIDTAVQASNIATSIANIFANETKRGPLGFITAGVQIAALLATWFSSLQQIRSTSAPTIAREGHSMILSGNSHESGGISLGDSNVEAEGGERMSIFSKSATSSYDKDIVDFTKQANKGNLNEFYLSKYRNLSHEKLAGSNLIKNDNRVFVDVNSIVSEQKKTNRLLPKTQIVGENSYIDSWGNKTRVKVR